MPSYDLLAPSFDRHRALPGAAAEAIRDAVLASVSARSRPRLLDVGAGTGRIGRAFVAAGDDYVGVDRSFGMLSEFGRRIAQATTPPRLVQADGRLLPFGDAGFDAVMLIQVFGAGRGWRRFIEEARRVLCPEGALVLGRAVAPAEGVDARMKERLAAILRGMGVAAEASARADAERLLHATAASADRQVVAAWASERSPRQFLDRHKEGARFAALPEAVKAEALRRLADWAAGAFGSLEAARAERHAFELRIFRFGEEAGPPTCTRD